MLPEQIHRALNAALLVLPILLVSACDTADQEAPVVDAASYSNPDHSRLLQASELTEATSKAWPAASYASAGLIQATEQRPGDPAQGRRALLEENYVNCGLPERLFRSLLGDAPVVTISGRDTSADGLPFSNNLITNDDGVKVVSSNCLTCHGTPLFGELVVGLGNEFLDFTEDPSAAVERAGLLVRGEQEIRSWELYADRIAAIAPFIRTHTVGVNPANNLTFALMSHRRAEDNAWSESPLLGVPPSDPAPVSVPPWWRMAKKPAMFNMGEGRGDHARFMMAASMLCTDTVAELDRIDGYAPDIRAYIASLKPPSWPFSIDENLASTGEKLFAETCSRCHGSYGSDPAYPARLVPIEVVGTDPLLIDFAQGDGARFIDWYNRSYYGQLSVAAPGPGYVAPPLDGIWATAPFLHNGSVPNLMMLLDSPTRPAAWRHVSSDATDVTSYDSQNVGWRFDVLDKATLEIPKPPRVYDTTLPGYSNAGHRFGDHLTTDQRKAIVEYLKTL